MLETLKKYKIYVLLSFLSILLVWPLFRAGYFPHHDDLQVMRVFEMRKCFEDFQIPCRWVPDMGYGNGYPLFNYYGVSPYYIGAIASFFTSFVYSAKVLFFIPLVLGGFSMYLLGKELFGRWPGLLCAVLFMFAPYRALDSYVRGAIDESFAIAIIPLVFYFSYRLIKNKTLGNFLGTALSLAAFLVSHNIMTILFLPVLGLWVLIWMFLNKKLSYPLILSFLLGLGLAAFFLFPAFLEKSLIQADSLKAGGSDFRVHFVTLNQLFIDRTWGYGASVFGPNDTISFQIGWPHWWFVILAMGILVYRIKFFKVKELGKRPLDLIAVFLILVFGFSIFLTHNKSTFIWLAVDILQFAQFPWRLLAVSIFTTSLLGGYVLYQFKDGFLKIKNIQIWGVVLVSLLTIVLNAGFFQPQSYFGWIDDKQKLSGELWRIQQQAGILDYLPVTAHEPKGQAPERPDVISGKAVVSKVEVKSNSWQFKADVAEKAKVEVPVFDFPNWKTFVNGHDYDHGHDNYLGRIDLNLEKGSYLVSGKFENTWVRTIANTVSLLSLAIVGLLIIFRKKIGKLI